MADSIQSKDRNRTTHFALLLLRIILGMVFMYHGSQKIFGWFGGHGMAGFTAFLESIKVPMPAVSAWLAASSEFFGGLLLLLGLGTRLVAIPVVITMLVAILTVHRNAFGSQNNGMEFPLTLAVVTTAIALAGPGRFSLDWFLGIERPKAP